MNMHQYSSETLHKHSKATDYLDHFGFFQIFPDLSDFSGFEGDFFGSKSVRICCFPLAPVSLPMFGMIYN